MKFQVPQFIEVEDKIFGQLTLKQFVYVVGGVGISVLIFRLLNFFIAVFVIVPIIALSLALAFYKVNNKPFIFTLEAAIRYFLGSKLYIWKKEPTKVIPREERTEEATESLFVPKLSDSKLKELTWSLDINENMSPGANESMRRRK